MVQRQKMQTKRVAWPRVIGGALGSTQVRLLAQLFPGSLACWVFSSQHSNGSGRATARKMIHHVMPYMVSWWSERKYMLARLPLRHANNWVSTLNLDGTSGTCHELSRSRVV